jgi:hypothetical protein
MRSPTTIVSYAFIALTILSFAFAVALPAPADRASINGVDISDLSKTVELGKKMIAFRANYSARAIRAAIDGR